MFRRRKLAEMPDLTNEVLAACAFHAQRLNVSEQIHPDDFIFWAIHDSAGLTDKTLAAGEYFESGYQTALFLKGVIDRIAGLPRPFSLLDFAGGYGRVARHIKNVMPDAQSRPATFTTPPLPLTARSVSQRFCPPAFPRNLTPGRPLT